MTLRSLLSAVGALVAVGGLPVRAAADDAPNVVVKEDLVYGRVHGAGLLADVAHPAGPGPFPAVVSVHGGRWRAGSKTDASAIKVREWACRGFFAMSIDYRLVGCTPAPACYQDMLCAVRFVHANAAAYHVDADRIFLIGQSAGGQMVALAATLGDGPYPRTGGWDKSPSTFRAAISVAGPYELGPLDWGKLWAPPGENPADAHRLASPLTHVTAKAKPLLVIHSDDDKSVPVQQALDVVAALKKAKAPHRFVHYKDKGHMGITADVIRESLAFIEEHSRK